MKDSMLKPVQIMDSSTRPHLGRQESSESGNPLIQMGQGGRKY
jgi:hypothetical protein